MIKHKLRGYITAQMGGETWYLVSVSGDLLGWNTHEENKMWIDQKDAMYIMDKAERDGACIVFFHSQLYTG